MRLKPALDAWAAAAAFAVTLAGLILGLWQAAAAGGVVGGLLARRGPLLSAVAGVLLAWLQVLMAQLWGTSAGRVLGALGDALGLPGALPFVLGSLLVALLLALPGAVVGSGLRGRIIPRAG